MPWHWCRWKETRRTFSPGRVGEITGDSDDLRFLMFGCTTVELRCEECGDLKAHIFPGDLTRTPTE